MNEFKTISLRGLLVWQVCAFFFLYEFLLRTIVGTFQSKLIDDLNLSPVKFSLLSATAYMLIYGLMQIPVGLIAARYSLKKILFVAVMLCAISTFGFSLVQQFSTAIICRMVMGFGSSFGFICLLIAVYDWMPRKNIALFVGLSQFIGTIGPMLAGGPLHSISHASSVGWRGIFFGLAIIGLFIAALSLIFVKNRQNSGKFIVLARPTELPKILLQLMSQKQVWFIAIYSGCVYFSIEYFSENIGIEFLVSKGFSSSSSAYMITLAWLGYALGCPLIGFISDKIQRRRSVMLASALLALVTLAVIIYFPLGKITTGIFFVLLGLSACGQSIGFATIAEQCKEQYLVVGLGFNNAMIALFISAGAPIIGYVLSQSAHIKNYKAALFILIALAITAVLISAFAIKETFCKPTRENTILSLKPILGF